MKTLFYILLFGLMTITACKSTSKVGTTTSKGTFKEVPYTITYRSNTDGSYLQPTVIDSTMAEKINTFDRSKPESVLTYFLASKIRGDNDWEEAVPTLSQRASKLRIGLQTYKEENWQFINAQLLEKEAINDNSYWIAVSLSLNINGEGVQQSAEDEFTLKRFGSEWFVVEVPN